jgi:hypothetical protein
MSVIDNSKGVSQAGQIISMELERFVCFEFGDFAEHHRALNSDWLFSLIRVLPRLANENFVRFLSANHYSTCLVPSGCHDDWGAAR